MQSEKLTNENPLANNKLILQWTSFPLLDYPIKSIILMMFLFFLGAALWWLAVINWKMPLFYVFGVLILVVELSPYFIPTTYYLYENKLIIYYSIFRVEKEISQFKCFYQDKSGILLGTYKRPTRMDRFRGQSLRFSKSKNEKNDLLDYLSRKIGKQF